MLSVRPVFVTVTGSVCLEFGFFPELSRADQQGQAVSAPATGLL